MRQKKVQWSLADNAKRERTKDEDKALKTGSRFQTGSPKPDRNGNRLVSMNSRTYPVENQWLTRARTGRGKREPVLGTGLHAGAWRERNTGPGKVP